MPTTTTPQKTKTPKTRHRRGKGELALFDETLSIKLEQLKKQLGYYPALIEIVEYIAPNCTTSSIYKSLRRLSAAGKLSKDAKFIYCKGASNE